MTTFINLLPLRYRQQQALRRWLRQWSVVWAGCALACLAVHYYLYHRYRALSETVEAAQRRCAPLEELMQNQDALRDSLRRLSEQGTLLGQLRNDRPLLSLIGLVSQSAAPCAGRLVVRHLSFERDDTAAATADKKTEPSKPDAKASRSWARMVIKGDAVDHLGVAQFAVGLRDTGLFRRVELKSCANAPAPGPTACSYVLECDL